MIKTLNKKSGDDYILGGENIRVKDYLDKCLKIRKKKSLPIRIPIKILEILNNISLKKIRTLNSIVKSPPENIYASSQKAIKNLNLRVSKLNDL